MNEQLKEFSTKAIEAFSSIPLKRKELLKKTATAIEEGILKFGHYPLMFVCTHNSRRSIFGQAYGHLAAAHYGLLEKISTYSAGTESTYLHPNAIASLRRSGFVVKPEAAESNPVLEFSIGNDNKFNSSSTIIEDKANPERNFMAIMVCSAAETNCPFVVGATKRIPITYEDPKISDQSIDKEQVYDARGLQMASELFYMMSLLKT